MAPRFSSSEQSLSRYMEQFFSFLYYMSFYQEQDCRGGVTVGAVGAIAPTVFSENLIDAEVLHPQFKRRIENWQLR